MNFKPPISACVICFNEERKIQRCLESLTWCDEIVVLDSFSTDSTLDVCRKFTANVHQQKWMGYVGQRNSVRLLAKNEWVLFLDADEEVSTELRDEIIGIFRKGPAPYIGFDFPRMVQYLGRWIKHGEWYPDRKLRLFMKSRGRSEGEEPHDRVVVNGPIRRLKNPLWHYTYDDIADHLATLDRFSTITAQQKFVAGAKFRWTDLVFRPPHRFLKGFFSKRGFLDGAHGFVIAVLAAYGATLKYIKLWELHLRGRKGM